MPAVGCEPVTDIAEPVVDVLAGLVAEAVPGIAAKIPPAPAAELGRTGVPPEEAPPRDTGFPGAVARSRVRSGAAGAANRVAFTGSTPEDVLRAFGADPREHRRLVAGPVAGRRPG